VTFIPFLVTMKKTTVLMVAVLVVVPIFAAGLTVLLDSVRDVQANPCSENIITQSPATEDSEEVDSDIDCEFYGPVDIIENGGLIEMPFILPTQ
jgi:hypothetical protein